MLILSSVVWICSIASVVVAASEVRSQDFPTRPIRIVTVEPGGGGDFAARIIAQGLTVNLGQQVIVDNRPAGVIPGEVVSKAPPDGYTLLLNGLSHLLLPFLQDNLTWDPVKDFQPITLATSAPQILVVYPSLPVKNVKELVALAKSRPGQLNYGMSGTASSGHLAGELLKSMAGIDVVRVSYKSGGQAVTDLIGGQVQMMIAAAGGLAQHVKSGRLRALAVTSAQPSALFPDLPTIAATVPGYELVAINGIFAPAKTPPAIINRLNQEILRVLKQADVKEKFVTSGVETVGSSPSEFATSMKADIARLGKLTKEAGIKVE